MIAEGRAKGIEFVMPVDFVLQDGRVSETIGPGDQQFDVGPATGELFEQTVGEFIAAAKRRQAAGRGLPQRRVRHVRGPAVRGGHAAIRGPAEADDTTRASRSTSAAAKGGTALEKYGKPDWVTYNFTAGGTVLNALGSEPVPYLVALWMAGQ